MSRPRASLLLVLLLSGCEQGTAGAGGFRLEIEARVTAAITGLTLDYDRIDVVHRVKLDGTDEVMTIERAERRLELTGPLRTHALGEYSVPQGFLSQIRFHVTAASTRGSDGGTLAVMVEEPGWIIDSSEHPLDICERTGVRARLDLERALAGPVAAEWFPGGGLDGESPGPVKGELTVVFKEGTSTLRVQQLNDELGACVLYYPALSNWYRIRLPPNLEPATALPFYRSKDEVSSAMDALNFGR